MSARSFGRVGTSCPEDAAPMLAQSARSLVSVKHRSIITVRNRMDCAFGVFDRAISFSAWLTSRPRIFFLVGTSGVSGKAFNDSAKSPNIDALHTVVVQMGHSGSCTTNRKHGKKRFFSLGSGKVVGLISTGTSTDKYVPTRDTGRSSS